MFKSLASAGGCCWQRYCLLSVKKVLCGRFASSAYKPRRKKHIVRNVEVPKNNYYQGKHIDRKNQYFYYVDSHGRLYLHESRLKNFLTSFKDPQFLTKFFNKITVNDGCYKDDFPFLVIWSKTEYYFIACDCVPIVFTHLNHKTETVGTKINIPEQKEFVLVCNHGDPGKASIPFEPTKLFMSNSGRIYHPAPSKAGGIGLVSTQLSVLFSSMLEFENGEDNGPTHIWFMQSKLALDCDWYKDESISHYIK